MSEITVFPQPRRIDLGEGLFTLDERTVIYTHESELGEMLAAYLRPATGYPLPVQRYGANAPTQAENAIVLQGSEKGGDGAEAYQLRVTPVRVDLAAGSADGIRHGIGTLRQLLPAEIMSGDRVRDVAWTMASVTINDAPAFAWRGLLLDVVRHMFSIEQIKRFIDLMALHKFNTLHMHLTDDQGWRVEIEAYPRLIEIGAFRRETVLPGNHDRYDGQRYGGSYSKAEMRELVEYAAARGVTILPEIELPGHALAALSAYPELGCAGAGYEVGRKWGIADEIFCAGKDEVFVFLKGVLSEVLEVFPSTFIHIGGDEAPKTRWQACPACQARIRTEGLADEHELQSWFVRQFDSWLSERGRRLVGWDEILEGGLAPNATVMSWRGSQGGIEAANAGHDVVMTPSTYCYLDYCQSDDFASEPPAQPNYLPLEQVYNFEVVPEDIDRGKRRHILGGQGNIWTEYIPNFEHLQYMAFPRAIAIADVLWAHPERRDFPDFLARLRRHLPRLDQLGVNYRQLSD